MAIVQFSRLLSAGFPYLCLFTMKINHHLQYAFVILADFYFKSSFTFSVNFVWSFFQMLQSQLAVQAAAGVNGVLDIFVESNQTNGLRSHSPSSPPQRKRGRPRMDECDKRPEKAM